VQIFGGNGLSRKYPIEKLLRDARASMIEDGCNDLLVSCPRSSLAFGRRFGRLAALRSCAVARYALLARLASHPNRRPRYFTELLGQDTRPGSR